MTPTQLKLESDCDRERKVKNSFLKHQIMSPFHLFHYSCMQLLSCPTFDTLFHNCFLFSFLSLFLPLSLLMIFFYSILLLSDARDVTDFTTYILQIGTSAITKNNSKHLFIIFFFLVFLLLSDTKDVTNFITYILQIGTPPITKNNSKHLFIILFE